MGEPQDHDYGDYGDYADDLFYEYYPCQKEPNATCLEPIIGKEMTEAVFNKTKSEQNCLYYEWMDFSTLYLEPYNITDPSIKQQVINMGCPPQFDGATCWPFVHSGDTHITTCPEIKNLTIPGLEINRSCTDGGWGSSNFEECLSDKGYQVLHNHCQPDDTIWGIDCNSILSKATTEATIPPLYPGEERMALALRDIYFFGSFASLMLLTIALIIFCIFKSLQCPRVHIHKNLVISLMIQCVLNIIIFEPFVTDMSPGSQTYFDESTDKKSYLSYSWLCKLLKALTNYAIMTNIFWAFVEGLFLISRISIAVFSSSTPYWLFYLIGWGIPGAFTIIWAVCVELYHKEQHCWRNYSETPYFALIYVPVVVAVVANVFFLICIIRILITKLHAVNTDEHVQIRKAMKATVVLLPLLSITSILFIWAPDIKQSPQANMAYRITNACLQVAQGIFVSVLFCFFNGEVRSALIKRWKQLRSETFRYRSSRASSVCVTQSEHLTMMNGNHSRRMSHTSHISAGTETGTAV